MHEFSPFQTKDQVVIGFVDMDNSESMKFRITQFFLYHIIYNGAPAFKGMTMGQGIIGECKVY
jgi:hypothetical protein